MTQAQPRTLLVAGSVHGIGRAIVAQAAARGCALALADIDADGLAAQARSLVDSGATVFARPVDVTAATGVRDFVVAAEAAVGRIDALVANAGGVVSLVAGGQVDASVKPFATSKPADWRHIVDLNLFATLNLCHAVLPGMVARGAGRLVLVSSAAGRNGAAGMAVYSAAKAGIIAFTEALAREVGHAGIAVNAVAPGGILTRAFPPGVAISADRLARIPAGRMG
ncbi:MAG: SDR family NAD(P)-dependent oxidoreductase, partial [Burkholderiales bacterium]